MPVMCEELGTTQALLVVLAILACASSIHGQVPDADVSIFRHRFRKLVSLGTASGSSGAATDDVLPGRFLVKLKVESDGDSARSGSRSTSRARGIVDDMRKRKFKVKLLREFSFAWTGFSLEAENPEQALAELDANSRVLSIYPVVWLSAPDDNITDIGSSNLRGSYSARTSSAPTSNIAARLAAAGRDRVDGTGIRVGIIDTGVDPTHPALAGKVQFTYDFVGDNFRPGSLPVPKNSSMDCSGHGTHVAGIIAGSFSAPNSGFNYSGVAPGVTLGAYKVFGCNGSTYTTNEMLVAAMDRAYQDGMQIINLSVGDEGAWQGPVADAAIRLSNLGVTVVAAVGNAGSSGLFMQTSAANAPTVLAAASIQSFAAPTTLKLRLSTPGSTAIDVHDVRGAYGNVSQLVSAPLRPSTVALTAGALSNATSGDGCITDTNAGMEFNGAVALLPLGGCSVTTKIANAVARRAVGVMLYGDDAALEDLWRVPLMGSPGSWPSPSSPFVVPVLAVDEDTTVKLFEACNRAWRAPRPPNPPPTPLPRTPASTSTTRAQGGSGGQRQAPADDLLDTPAQPAPAPVTTTPGLPAPNTPAPLLQTPLQSLPRGLPSPAAVPAPGGGGGGGGGGNRRLLSSAGNSHRSRSNGEATIGSEAGARAGVELQEDGPERRHLQQQGGQQMPVIVGLSGTPASSFSSWGPSPTLRMKPSVAAPGGDILSTVPRGIAPSGYAYLSGTSQAAPYVTGAMALAMDAFRNNNLSQAQLEASLLLTAVPLREVMDSSPTPQPSQTVASAVRVGAGTVDIAALLTNLIDINTTCAEVLLNQVVSTSGRSGNIIELGSSLAGGKRISCSIDVTNRGSSPLTFQLLHVGAATVNASTQPTLDPKFNSGTNLRKTLPYEAALAPGGPVVDITFSTSRITNLTLLVVPAGPGGRVRFRATFGLASWATPNEFLFSGYILFNPLAPTSSDDSGFSDPAVRRAALQPPLYLPYSGYSQRLTDLRLLLPGSEGAISDPTGQWIWDGEWHGGESTLPPSYNYFEDYAPPPPPSAPFPIFYLSGPRASLPAIALFPLRQPRDQLVELYRLQGEQKVGIITVTSTIRRLPSGLPFIFTWRGLYFDIRNRREVPISRGTYYFVVRLTRPAAINEDLTSAACESWRSPAFSILI